MVDILLTHGFFMDEDDKEQSIMRPYPPLGLLYLSSYLKKSGFKPKIFDTTFTTRADLYKMIRSACNGIVGIYTTHMTRKSVIALIAVAKASNRIVILRGHDSANYPVDYLSAGADIIVIGEGELTLNKVLTVLKTRGIDNLQDLTGIIFKDGNGNAVQTPPAEMTDIDTLPWPDRHGIEMESYLHAWKKHHGQTSINLITARGCPYHCRWCSHAVFGSTYRRRAAVDCADEVAYVYHKYRPDQLWYSDDVFTMNHDWLFQFADQLKQRDLYIPFETISRADRLLDESVCRKLKEMGCHRIWIGSESGSNRILKAMARGVTAQQITTATAMVQKYGIEVGWFVMWGYEEETIEDIQATIEHVKQGKPDTFFTTVVYPIRGTPYFNDIKGKVKAPQRWETATEKDNIVGGRPSEAAYKLADRWLRDAVEADRLLASDPDLSKQKHESADAARRRFLKAYDSGK